MKNFNKDKFEVIVKQLNKYFTSRFISATAGVTYDTFISYLNGRRSPKPDQLTRMVETFNVFFEAISVLNKMKT